MQNPLPQNLPALNPEPPTLDANGFDPTAFDWIPVARQPRADGWSPTLQKRFIEALADTGSVTEAARDVQKSVTSCYRLRRAPGAEGFAAAWEAALAEATRRLVDIAFDRAVNGTEEPVLDKHGNCIATRHRTNDRLLMFLLRAHYPDRYRPEITRAAPRIALESPAEPPRLTDALAALTPETPAEPHRLMDPQAFDDLLFNIAALAEPEHPLAALSSLSPEPKPAAA